MKKIVVAIGDVHGCLEELDELLKTIQYNQSSMRLVFLGDLVHRGPDSAGVVSRVMELNVECIKGNHEDKLLRWRKHELNSKPNPMKRISEFEQRSNLSVSDYQLKWLDSLPIKLYLDSNWWAVHAGVAPHKSLSDQNANDIMRVRYVNKDGKAKPLNKDKSQPDDTVYWDEAWVGKESFIYGHCVHSLTEPRVTINKNNTCIGIDTGCCFGGNLTSILLDTENNSYSFVAVKAKENYARKS